MKQAPASLPPRATSAAGTPSCARCGLITRSVVGSGCVVNGATLIDMPKPRQAIDREAEVLRYFHNAGLYELSGEDYRGIFRLDGFSDPVVLPPYVELVRFGAGR